MAQKAAAALTLIHTLQKICSMGPQTPAAEHSPEHSAEHSMERSIGSIKVSLLVKMALAVKSRDEKLVIVSGFTKTLDAIQAELHKAAVPASFCSGCDGCVVFSSPVTSHQLPFTSHLPLTSYLLPVTSYQVTSYHTHSPVNCHQLPVACY